MLSLPTVRAVIGCLLHADAHLRTDTGATPPVLLVIQQRPATSSGKRLRRLRTIGCPLHCIDVASPGLADLLTDLADQLTGAAPPTSHANLCPTVCAALRAATRSEARLLAYAVRYDDVFADTEAISGVRRVDAVDIDGRVYQITRPDGAATAVVLVDERPDPADTPATQPGLAALVAATITSTDPAGHLTTRATDAAATPRPGHRQPRPRRCEARCAEPSTCWSRSTWMTTTTGRPTRSATTPNANSAATWPR
jgi:hypothetical protein